MAAAGDAARRGVAKPASPPHWLNVLANCANTIQTTGAYYYIAAWHYLATSTDYTNIGKPVVDR